MWWAFIHFYVDVILRLFQVATACACAELQSSHCMLHIYCIYFTIIMALDTVNDGVQRHTRPPVTACNETYKYLLLISEFYFEIFRATIMPAYEVESK